MAQSLNKTVEFHTTGVSYLGVGGKVGKILVGNAAFEFYADANVEDYIQIPWQEIERIGANVSGRKIYTRESKFLFASKDSGKILKIAREHLGNDKIVKLPTLIQIITAKIKNLFAK